MKTNLKLNSTLSLKALEAKARRNATIAAIKNALPSSCRQNCDTVSNRHHRAHPPLIQRDINSIYQTLKHKASDNQVIVFERPDRYRSCKATISIYSSADILRQKEEEAAYRMDIAAFNGQKKIKKPNRAKPQTMYAFYPDILDPNKLGSVAIYGDCPEATRSRILINGTLFGHLVKRAVIEKGLRPFVDVTLAPMVSMDNV